MAVRNTTFTPPNPVAFSDLRDRELSERKRLQGRRLLLETLPTKRPRTPEEDAELTEIVQKLATDDVVDPLFLAVRSQIAPTVGDHDEGLLPSQQWLQEVSAAASSQNPSDLSTSIAELVALAGLGVYDANQALANSLKALVPLPATNPAGFVKLLTTLSSAFDTAVLGFGNAGPVQKDLDKLAALIRKIQTETLKGAEAFGGELATAVSSGQLAGAEKLVDLLNLFITKGVRTPSFGLSPDEKLLAAVYGCLEADRVDPPADHSRSVVVQYDPDAERTRQVFGKALFSAQGEYRTNLKLFEAVLPFLIRLGAGTPIDVVDASEWARVVRALIQRGIAFDEVQMERRVDEALDIIQNVGADAPTSSIPIDLPDLDATDDFQIQADNIRALQPAYFAAMFEELKAFAVVDKLVELFQNGVLPVGRGEAGNGLFKYWKETAIRVSEAERRSFYARTLGVAGGDDGGMPNREFNDLLLRFVSSVSSFVRQNNVDDLLRTRIAGAISQQQVRKSARDLANNLSLHGYGMAYFMATELQKQVKDVIKLLSDPDIRQSYGARDMWQVIDQVAALELGGARNSLRYRTMAASGAIIMAWLANHARELSNNSFGAILDIDEIRNPSPRLNGAKPTTAPNDSDLLNACEQWLAVTGTQEDTVEDYAQHKESPMTTSRPIQIPSIARDLLDSAGVPAMSLGNGYNRR